MDKAVLDTKGNLSFMQNAHWNPDYRFPVAGFPPQGTG